MSQVVDDPIYTTPKRIQKQLRDVQAHVNALNKEAELLRNKFGELRHSVERNVQLDELRGVAPRYAAPQYVAPPPPPQLPIAPALYVPPPPQLPMAPALYVPPPVSAPPQLPKAQIEFLRQRILPITGKVNFMQQVEAKGYSVPVSTAPLMLPTSAPLLPVNPPVSQPLPYVIPSVAYGQLPPQQLLQQQLPKTPRTSPRTRPLPVTPVPSSPLPGGLMPSQYVGAAAAAAFGPNSPYPLPVATPRTNALLESIGPFEFPVTPRATS